MWGGRERKDVGEWCIFLDPFHGNEDWGQRAMG